MIIMTTTPTLEGLNLGTVKIEQSTIRTLIKKKTAYLSSAYAIVWPVLGVLKQFKIEGIYTASSGSLDEWEDDMDEDWCMSGIPERKILTTESGRTFNVVPENLIFKRYHNKITYTLVVVQAAFDA